MCSVYGVHKGCTGGVWGCTVLLGVYRSVHGNKGGPCTGACVVYEVYEVCTGQKIVPIVVHGLGQFWHTLWLYRQAKLTLV